MAKKPNQLSSQSKPVLEPRRSAEFWAAEDYLCPVPGRLCYRFIVAQKNWRGDNSKRTSKLLADELKVSESTISETRKIEYVKRKRLNPEKLEEVAKNIFEVDPDWLIKGYADDGRNCWPSWFDPNLRNYRRALADVVIQILGEYVMFFENPEEPNQIKPMNPDKNAHFFLSKNNFMYGLDACVLQNYSKTNSCDKSSAQFLQKFLDNPQCWRMELPYFFDGHRRLPDSVLHSRDLYIEDMVKYMIRNNLSQLDYLSRYSTEIVSIWTNLVIEALEPKAVLPDCSEKKRKHNQLLCWVARKMGFSRELEGKKGGASSSGMWRPSFPECAGAP